MGSEEQRFVSLCCVSGTVEAPVQHLTAVSHQTWEEKLMIRKLPAQDPRAWKRHLLGPDTGHWTPKPAISATGMEGQHSAAQ